jgi:hypothetical protein
MIKESSGSGSGSSIGLDPKLVAASSVADADTDPAFYFDPDPAPTFHFDSDPDPTFQFDPDPDPDPTTHFFPN